MEGVIVGRHIKGVVNGILLLIIIVSLAYNDTIVLGVNTDKSKSNYSNTGKSEVIANDVDRLTSSMDSLYNWVADGFSMPYKYVKIMHLVAGGRAIFTDKNPDIYTDLTSIVLMAPFDIEGALNEYSDEAPVACGDSDIIRPNKYYLPDAAYNVTLNISNIMNTRYKWYEDRGEEGLFNKLKDDIKSDIVFYEAMIEYCGGTESEINSVLDTYVNLIAVKDRNEYVVYINNEGEYRILGKYDDIFTVYGEDNKNRLAIALSFDSYMATAKGVYDIMEDTSELFEVGSMSRETLLIASMSLVGKVRYVWGGGHMGANSISGESPIWEMFNKNYEGNNSNCMSPTLTWCPIHGYTEESESSCLFEDNKVGSVNDYLKLRGDIINKSEKVITYKGLVKIFGGDLEKPIEPHRLEGLDCSGFVGWVYNQVDKDKKYWGLAEDFVSVNNMQNISIDSELLPGDVVAWDKHIVIVVGKVTDSNKSYVIIEQAPNRTKFGVLVRNGINGEELDKAKEIARDANCALGSTMEEEYINIYNINNLEYQQDEESEEPNKILSIGRMKERFIDEDKAIRGSTKRLIELNAEDIIRYSINTIRDRSKKNC